MSATPNDMDRAEYRRIRCELGLDQQELADWLGVQRQTVSRRETGFSPIDREAEYALYWLAYGEHDE